MQNELDQTLPFGRCFSGGGEVAEIDKPVGFHQHGLYFGHDGKLLVDHPYNVDKLAKLAKLGLNPEATAPLAEQKEERKPVNPEVVAKLELRSDEELAATGAKLVEMMAGEGQVVEAPTDRNGLIRFIADYAS